MKASKPPKITIEPHDAGNLARFARPAGYARRLGCSKRHVERLMQTGAIPFLKTGHRSIFIPIDEADAALLKLAVSGQKGGEEAQMVRGVKV